MVGWLVRWFAESTVLLIFKQHKHKQKHSMATRLLKMRLLVLPPALQYAA